MTTPLEHDPALTSIVEAAAREHGTPGVSAGVLVGGRALVATVGVTSTTDPLAVDEDTLFMVGSTSKTFTATAVMALIDRGSLSLLDRVADHLPDLRLQDEQVAATVTVHHLLNHTSGWRGDLLPGPDWGDGALRQALGALADAPQQLPLGVLASYSNSGFLLAGHLLATVHGTTFEQAVRELVLEPLGLTGSWYLPWEVAHRRHAVGHVVADGAATPVPTWPVGRSTGPAGGLCSSLRDQLAWARYHLDGTTTGTAPLRDETRLLMQQPTVAVRAALDGIGLSWLLTTHGDLRLVTHGGNVSNLQTSTFVLVPEHDVAVTVMANTKHGTAIGETVLAWVLEHHLSAGPKPVLPTVPFVAEELVGRYDMGPFAWQLTLDDGRLLIELVVPDDVDEQLRVAFANPPRELVGLAPDALGLASDPTGAALEVRRAPDGTVAGIVHGLRYAPRVLS